MLVDVLGEKKMIFLSHNHKDKVLVEQLALKLKDIYGEERVFYDSWSIQPGDSILDKMNTGLAKCKVFFFFMSKNSLKSEMVKLEWQAALMKKSNNKNIKFIPVRLSKCNIPPILKSILYLDLYTTGLQGCLSQMVYIIQNSSTFTPNSKEYFNLVWSFNKLDKQEAIVKVTAKDFFEPIAKFLVLHDFAKDEIEVSLLHQSMYSSGFKEQVKLNNGNFFNASAIATTGQGVDPKHPLEIQIKVTNVDKDLQGIKLMHKSNGDTYSFFPYVEELNLQDI